MRYIFFIALSCFSVLPVQAQTGCNDPIPIQSITVSNTSCGNTTGFVLIDIGGSSAPYNFEWTPAVSTTNAAFEIGAGTYTVRIIRANDPDCFIDTTIVVNNSNGPAVQVVAIEPANCLTANGKVTLAPFNLNYTWDNGETGPINDGLTSKCYYVTATDPGNGCFSVLKMCVPNFNPLETTALVTKQAKCGRPTGEATITVTGGSGNYAYSLGATNVIKNLPPGPYVCQVNDIASGCKDAIGFNIQQVAVSASVDITKYNVTCPGGSNGFVGINVLPGQNFTLPFEKTILDANGNPVQATNLKAGTYFLSIVDLDSCAIPVQTFTINEPPSFNVYASIEPVKCDKGGTITLTISGGNPGKKVDWFDLPGNNDPTIRTDLSPGRYSGYVYDSIFCQFPMDTFLVPSACSKIDTLKRLIGINSSDTFCLSLPVGVLPSQVNFSLINGGNSGGSAYGFWSVTPTGCLYYTAYSNAGFGVDTICLVRKTPYSGLNDTVCLIYSISSIPVEKQVVYLTVQVNNPGLVCGNIPNNFSNPIIYQLDDSGLTGNRAPYGNYTINGTNSCLTFLASGLPVFNVPEISVGIYDPILKAGKIICYNATVLNPVDCDLILDLGPDLVVPSVDCSVLKGVCLPIPYTSILQYNIFDNGLPYNQGYLGCNEANVSAYKISDIPSGGPYQLSGWTFNGDVIQGVFADITGLVSLMNQVDESGWAIQDNFFIIGGDNSVNTYGTLKVKTLSGFEVTLPPTQLFVARGTDIRFTEGEHQLIMSNVTNGCADTVNVRVECVDCLPIHNYVNTPFGIEWDTEDCFSDTIFCTNIPLNNINDYTITDNNQPILNTSSCGANLAFRFDTGYHQIKIINNITTCQYDIFFYYDCFDFIVKDTIVAEVDLEKTKSICFSNYLTPPIISLANLCIENSDGNAMVDYDETTGCITLTGKTAGLDTLCIEVCNGNGECVVINVLVRVGLLGPNILLAVTDAVFTPKDSKIIFPIAGNDYIFGIPGNTDGLTSIVILTNPTLGMIDLESANGLITYTPKPGACGIDSFQYKLTDTLGQTAIGTVKITIVCEKVLVFNGISPNNDNLNDAWHIVGIEAFPNNEVKVYNRWGNQVFNRLKYNNDEGWNGTWDGKDLPDGTYFYVIDLGDGEKPISGYMQINR